MTFVSDRSFYGFYGCRQQQDKTTRQDKTKNNSVELVASLAPAEAEIGALAKADQKFSNKNRVLAAWTATTCRVSCLVSTKFYSRKCK